MTDPPGRSVRPSGRRLRAFTHNPLVALGAAVVAVYILAALAAPLLAGHPPQVQYLDERLAPPGPRFPLGLDQLGRDIFSRLLFGARISLVVGLVVVGLAGVLGTTVGGMAGFASGAVDHILMRVTDVFFAFPPLILAMAIAAALGPSLSHTMVAIAGVTWPVYARLSRAQTLVLTRLEFLDAARAMGAGDRRIITRHLLPNALAPLIVQASFNMGEAILIAAGLSFIGFGAQPPTPEWGVMVSEGRDYITTQWWVPTFPGLAILLAVAGFNLLGDGIRDVLDPRLRQPR